MKCLWTVASTVLLVGSALGVAPAQTPPATRSEARSAAHAWLLGLAGAYTTENTFSPAPGAPPRRSVGTATLTPVLDGGFLREEPSTEMGPGRVQAALKIWGYDTTTRRFQAAWTYTGSTSILLPSGDAAADMSVVTYEGQYVEPTTGRDTLRVELRPVDASRFTLVLWSFGEDGKERATLQTIYTRSR